MGKRRFDCDRIQKLSDQLEAHRIDRCVRESILEGGESIQRTSGQQVQAGWLAGAMAKMNQALDAATVQSIREACACCLGGKRLQVSQAIRRAGRTLEERIQMANDAPFVFGHSVERMADGKIAVQFSPDGLTKYSCPCLRQVAVAVPLTYCMCCGGHVKHHLQAALGERLVGTVVTSALSSGGKMPCRFEFEVASG